MYQVLTFDAADAGDTDWYQIDFADGTLARGPCLLPGDTIISATITTSVLSGPIGGGDVVALVTQGAQITGPDTAPLTRVLTQVQAGGTVGATYLLIARVVTASGRVLVRSGQLRITDRGTQTSPPGAPPPDTTPIIAPMPPATAASLGAVIAGAGLVIGDDGTLSAPALTMALGLTAAGTTQGNALALAAGLNLVSIVPTGGGCVLPAAPAAASITVVNKSAADLLIYPPGTARIDGGGAGIPVIIGPNQRVMFVTQSATTAWSIA